MERIWKHKDPRAAIRLQPDTASGHPRSDARALLRGPGEVHVDDSINRMLLEVGYSTNIERLSQYLPARHPAAPRSRRLVPRRLARGPDERSRWKARSGRRIDRHAIPIARCSRVALSYVTGTHCSRAACSGRSAWTATRRCATRDLIQNYSQRRAGQRRRLQRSVTTHRRIRARPTSGSTSRTRGR